MNVKLKLEKLKYSTFNRFFVVFLLFKQKSSCLITVKSFKNFLCRLIIMNQRIGWIYVLKDLMENLMYSWK